MTTLKYTVHKCPSCGSNEVTYDKKTKILSCPYCSSVFYVEEEEKMHRDHEQKKKLIEIFIVILVAISIIGLTLWKSTMKESNQLLDSETSKVLEVKPSIKVPTPMPTNEVLVTPTPEELKDVQGLGIFKSEFTANIISLILCKPIQEITMDEVAKFQYLNFDFGSGLGGYYGKGVRVSYSYENLRVIESDKRVEYISEVYYDYDYEEEETFPADLVLFSGLTIFETDYSKLLYECLINLPYLTEVSFSGFSDVSQAIEVVDPQKIERITFGNGLYDLTGIQAFVNLRELYLYSTSVESINELGGLTNLTTLWLDQNYYVESYDPINTLQKLKVLYIDDGWYGDFDAQCLVGLQNLEKFTLCNVKLENPEALQKLPQLTLLKLSNNDITKDYSYFYNQISLKTLTIDLNDLEEYDDECLQWLSSCKNLESVDFTYMKNSSILTVLPNISELYIHGGTFHDLGDNMKELNNLNKLSIESSYYLTSEDLKHFHDLNQLKTLAITNSYLGEDSASLFELTQLESLDLSSTSFYIDFSSSPNVKSLKTLNLSGSYVYYTKDTIPEGFYYETDKELIEPFISWLDVKDTLLWLDVSSNGLEDGSFLSEYTNLQYLNISNNWMKKIAADAFINLNQLRNLVSSRNDFESIEFVQMLENLTTLDLSEIEEIKYGLDLSHLKQLRYVKLNQTKADLLVVPEYCTIL